MAGRLAGKTLNMLVRVGISVALFVVFLLHTSGAVESRLLTTIENLTYDGRVLLTMSGTVDPRVVIIDLDEKSLAAEGQWPWARDKLARLVTQLFDKYQARVLGFDMHFPEPDRASGLELLQRLATGPLSDLQGFPERIETLKPQLDTDHVFAEAMKGRPIVAGYTFRPAMPGEKAPEGAPGPALMDKATTSQYSVAFIGHDSFTANLPELRSAAQYGGFFDLPTLDADGVVRDVPLVQRYHSEVFSSLALEVLRVALGNPAAQLEFEPADARAGLNLERVRVGDA